MRVGLQGSEVNDMDIYQVMENVKCLSAQERALIAVKPVFQTL